MAHFTHLLRIALPRAFLSRSHWMRPTFTLATLIIVVPAVANRAGGWFSLRYRIHLSPKPLHRHHRQGRQPDCDRSWRLHVRARRGRGETLALRLRRYVSVSRASHEAILFTNDAQKLGREMGTELTKTLAFQITDAASLGHGIDIGFK